ncbi:hypothetical protein KUF71_002561 [Frankliniella fusca]|uniref:Uncharacterized protein n=1 Tax=Frankliniella fusca TaxID=407009 RepID=A0AAE1LLW9_9NEOP|nr:hypothetical protein KUF71_002561 [Frankliniella fusca]
MITLYVPWINEVEDLVQVDPKAKAEENMQLINENRKRYNYFDEDTLELALQDAQKTAEERETEEEADSNAPRHDLDDYDLNDPQCQADVFADMGGYQARTYDEGFCSPGRLTDEEYFNLIAKLNPEQLYSTDPTRSSNKFRSVFRQNLWEMFKVHRLTQIMRQSNQQFQTALNNLAKGTLPQEDKSLFLSRTFPALTPEAVDSKPVHLFARNDLVDAWNEQALDQIGYSGQGKHRKR